ncbi:MAG: response regulator transcription factor [Acidobacteriota bacterium]
MIYKIGIVEDDELIRNMIRINLEKSGFEVVGFSEAEKMYSYIRKGYVDILILDIMLDGITGTDLLKKLREKQINIPVLMVTAKNDIQNKINTLNMGADDYLPKPFNMEELIARVKALVRRSQGKRFIPSSQILILNGFKISFSSRKCDSNQGEIILSEKEIKLLSFFVSNIGQTIKRADILEEVWGMDVSPTPRTVDNFILKFRKLFEKDPSNPQHFISVRNKGYRFEN